MASPYVLVLAVLLALCSAARSEIVPLDLSGVPQAAAAAAGAADGAGDSDALFNASPSKSIAKAAAAAFWTILPQQPLSGATLTTATGGPVSLRDKLKLDQLKAASVGGCSGALKMAGGATGQVLTGLPNVYLLYYAGSTPWAAADKALLNTFMAGVGTSSYANIHRNYIQGNGAPMAVGATLAGTADWSTAWRSQPVKKNAVTEAEIGNLVSAAIAANAWNKGTTPEANALYFVLTGPGVAVGTSTSGMCNAYCGWHNRATVGSTPIQYGIIGHPGACINACTPFPAGSGYTSPNQNPAIDGMISVLAHEWTEAMTDPDVSTGYSDATGCENADKCAWQYGAVSQGTYGTYNLAFGGKQYLVQQNWKISTPKINACCGFSFAGRCFGSSTCVSYGSQAGCSMG